MIKKLLQYMDYIIKHKYYVLKAGLIVKAPLWRLIIHDWSKFLPSEWSPYQEYFYGTKSWKTNRQFRIAWLKHIHRNPHHWQYWILLKDDGSYNSIEMPEPFAREMVADWLGANRTITGKWHADKWYTKNKDVISMHPDTQKFVEHLLMEKAHLLREKSS